MYLLTTQLMFSFLVSGRACVRKYSRRSQLIIKHEPCRALVVSSVTEGRQERVAFGRCLGKCYMSFPYVTKHYDSPGISPRSSAVSKTTSLLIAVGGEVIKTPCVESGRAGMRVWCVFCACFFQLPSHPNKKKRATSENTPHDSHSAFLNCVQIPATSR